MTTAWASVDPTMVEQVWSYSGGAITKQFAFEKSCSRSLPQVDEGQFSVPKESELLSYSGWDTVE